MTIPQLQALLTVVLKWTLSHSASLGAVATALLAILSGDEAGGYRELLAAAAAILFGTATVQAKSQAAKAAAQ
ncbi:hypothetical protein [Aquisphaera insulae]|uniref:hypothetical protein n=1 Tax=Aquisphaera insulae TaxID=2712864 RepID=UPI0013EE15DC|nr:hypothetical protein [Aquisphaera insulae]